MSQPSQQPPEPQTSQAAAPQVSVSPAPGQRPQLPPRQLGQPSPSVNPNKETAPPRVLTERRGPNPFADPVARRKQLDQLRADRNVEPPKERSSETADSAGVESGNNDPPKPAPPADDKRDASSSGAAGSDALSVLTAQYQARENAVQAAEAKVREATTAADKRAAEAEAAEKRAEAKLKRLEMVAHDPAQFLTDAGIKKEDFTNYLSNGGEQTPEQKRLSAQELQVQQLQDQIKQLREEQVAAQSRARRDAEDSAFKDTLSKEEYTLVGALGGVQAVRAHQTQLSQQLGKSVSLAEAATHLEGEFDSNFKKILAIQSVRRKLGLQPIGDKPASESKPNVRTLDTAHTSSTTSVNGARPAWNDWKGKVALLKEQQERASRQ